MTKNMIWTRDEKAAHKANKKYVKAIEEYGLDKINDGWGQTTKRYMSDAFFAGFYAGRDYG
ncbi:unnamed protein product, partial [marine sediment metagenome]